MTLEEAINEINKRSINICLHWYVCKWNDDYIIHSSTYMKKFPETSYVYATGHFNNSWDIIYSLEHKTFKHRAVINKYDERTEEGTEISKKNN